MFAVNTLSLSIKNVRQQGTPRREFVPGYPANICSSHNYNTGHFCEETTIIFLVFSYFEGVSPCGMPQGQKSTPCIRMCTYQLRVNIHLKYTDRTSCSLEFLRAGRAVRRANSFCVGSYMAIELHVKWTGRFGFSTACLSYTWNSLGIHGRANSSNYMMMKAQMKIISRMN